MRDVTAMRATRRSAMRLLALGGLGFAAFPQYAAARQRGEDDPLGTSTEVEATNWGVEALWSLGHGEAPVPRREALPPKDWVSVIHPVYPSIGFIVPPDWEVVMTDGPYWEEPVSLMLISPGRDAALLSSVFDGLGETARRVAEIGVQRVSLAKEELPIVRADEEGDGGLKPVMAIGSNGEAHAVAGAYLIQGIPSFSACYATDAVFEQRTREVFLPVLYQTSLDIPWDLNAIPVLPVGGSR